MLHNDMESKVNSGILCLKGCSEILFTATYGVKMTKVGILLVSCLVCGRLVIRYNLFSQLFYG